LEGLDADRSVSVGLQQGAQAAVAQAIIRQRQGGEAVAEAKSLQKNQLTGQLSIAMS
jgi:hypothetical protein